MPTMDEYDVPHEKTVIHSGYLYGCHTTEPDNPRGRPNEITVQDGYFESGDGEFPKTRTPKFVKITSEWLPRKCGHILRITDPACTGCTNRTDDES